ncbi:MAG: hypothetical protein WBR15_08125 [Gammaproteobacteria bacterium]
MNTHKHLIPKLILLLAGSYGFLMTPASAQNIVTGKSKTETLQLGQIKVTGQAMILKTLQIIKQGLQEPYSNDPKLANVVICRMNLEAGSHVRSTLICATNRVLSEGRDAIHVAGANAQANETGGICEKPSCVNMEYEQIFAPLNETLNSLPGHYLHASVNAPALQGLLQNIPLHVAKTPAKTPAPAAGTRD